MRELAHLISVVLVVPSLALASLFVALGHATSQSGFIRFILAALEAIVVLLPWLLVCSVLLIVLAFLGFSQRHRWAAAIATGGIAVGATGVLLWMTGTVDWANATFHLPAAIALVISVWLATTEWPDAKPTGVRQIDDTRLDTAVERSADVDTARKTLTLSNGQREAE